MSAARKQSNVNVRVTPDELELMKRGAETCGKSLSSFVVEAATYSAQKALLDQRFMHLDAELFDSVVEMISQPAEAHPKLAALLKNDSRWATSEN
jgi:uncharacterized protein (DUF1778 family)